MARAELSAPVREMADNGSMTMQRGLCSAISAAMRMQVLFRR